MSKFKELATIIVDTVFVNFPLDSERYELWVLLTRLRGKGLIVVLGHNRISGGNPHVYEILHGLGKTISRCACAFVKVWIRKKNASQLELDRARRLTSSLCPDQLVRILDSVDPTSEAIACVWDEVIWTLGTHWNHQL